MKKELQKSAQAVATSPPPMPPEYPVWFNGKQINEVMFCASFLNRHPMRCVNGILYDVNG